MFRYRSKVVTLLRPLLQFYHVSLWVRDIRECDPARARNVYRNKLANSPAPCGNHRISEGLDVINRKGDMG